MDLKQWRAVPAELTAEMENAIRNGYGWKQAHRDMLAAAPTEGAPELVDPVELARLRKNDVRYQFLRQQHWSDGLMCVVMDPANAVKLGRSCPSFDLLDTAVDAAIAQQESGK